MISLPTVPTHCYLAFRWRLAAPLGSHECFCQRNRMEVMERRRTGTGCCFSLCVKMRPLIQLPLLSSLCLLSLFVSEMIPSVMSKATLSYSCCRGNQLRENLFKLPQPRLKWVNMIVYRWCFRKLWIFCTILRKSHNSWNVSNGLSLSTGFIIQVSRDLLLTWPSNRELRPEGRHHSTN